MRGKLANMNKLSQSSTCSRQADLKCINLAVYLSRTTAVTKPYHVHDSMPKAAMAQEAASCNQRDGGINKPRPPCTGWSEERFSPYGNRGTEPEDLGEASKQTKAEEENKAAVTSGPAAKNPVEPRAAMTCMKHYVTTQ